MEARKTADVVTGSGQAFGGVLAFTCPVTGAAMAMKRTGERVYVVAVAGTDGEVSPDARRAALEYTETLQHCTRLSEGATVLVKVMRVCLPGIG